ncbi:MAG: aspartyl/glutamyl-tRNA amidotransferase subunit C [Ruminococcaceae bacterium]|nr:aspartyl/glutamyl-tRNA amidotransferase subunit C [Oscillospiraceae bacterium]
MQAYIQHLARLAKLSVPNDKLNTFTEKMCAFMKLAETLPPLEMDERLPAERMLLRPDTVQPSLPRESVLHNAPKVQDEYIAAPGTLQD